MARLNEGGAPRAVAIAAILAIVLFVAWMLGRGDEHGGSVASIARDAGLPARDDEPAPSAEASEPGAKPRPPTGESGAPVTASYPWANEQPPPDYMGEPDDAGRPLPAKAPRDYDVIDDEELDARRRETIDFLGREIDELERRASHADESGDSTLATSLRAQRSRLEARRDALRSLVGP